MDCSTKDCIDSNFCDRDTRLATVVAGYQALLESGQRPDRTAFLLQHSEFAEELVPCLEALEFVGNLVPTAYKLLSNVQVLNK